MKKNGIKVSSPDFVNFPFDSDCESCCGTDGLFVSYEFTFQHACKLIMEKGSVCWNDMDNIDFKEPEAYKKMKSGWNGGGQYYTLADSPEIIILDTDKNGFNVYGQKGGSISPKKRGFFF